MPSFYRQHKKIISVLMVAVFAAGGGLFSFSAVKASFWRPVWLDNALASLWVENNENTLASQASLEATYQRYLNSLQEKLSQTTDATEQAAIQSEIADVQKAMQPDQLQKDYESAMKQSQADQQTSQTPGTLESILGSMIAWFLYYIAVGLGWIMMLITKVMLTIGVFNSFLSQPAVKVGWTITRDICNNFFIIFMMILAAGVTLHLPSYTWRTMLPKILIFAVLINFSMIFTGILIDVSQVIMLTFASPLATTQGYNIIISAFGLPSSTMMSQTLGSWVNGSSSSANGAINVQDGGIQYLDIVAALLFAIIVTIVAVVVIVCITVILVYRIIMLMFLVVLSPLYFLSKASNVSALGSMGSQWMSQLFSMLTVGPAMFFFLYLSFMTMATVNNYTGLASTTAGIATTASGLLLNDPNLKSQVDASASAKDVGATINKGAGNSAQYVALSNMASVTGVLNFLVVVGLLWASLMMGRKFGDAAGSTAGKGMGWLSSAAKKYSGFNLGKTALKKAPSAIGTAVDDKLGIRQKLYSGVYEAGGKYVPFAREALGGRLGALEGGTAKRLNARVQSVGQAAGVNDMNEAQLRKLANSGTTYEKIAATQAMMKKGLISDDEADESKKRNNAALINQARKTLAGTDLGKEFDDNLRKYSTNVALNTIYDKDGKLNREKLESDLKTGKMDISKVMGSLDKATLAKMQASIGGGDAIAKFMMQYGGGDLSKIDKAMSSEIKKEVWSGVNHETFAKRDAQGNIVKENGSIVYDSDRRKEYLSVKNDVAKAFNLTDEEEKKSARKYFSENRGKVLDNMDASGMGANFISNFGDLASVKDLDKFSDRSEEAKKKLQDALKESLSKMDFLKTDVKIADDLIKKNLVVNGVISGADYGNSAAGNEALGRVLKGLKAEDAERIKWDGLDDTIKRTVAFNIDPNTLRVIGMRGNNNSIVKGVKGTIETAAQPDNEAEKEFNDAKNKYLSAKKKLDDLQAQIKNLSTEQAIAQKANDATEAAKINLRIDNLRRQVVSEMLEKKVVDTGQILIEATRNATRKRRGAVSGGNWVKTDEQNKQQEMQGKKKKGGRQETEEEES